MKLVAFSEKYTMEFSVSGKIKLTPETKEKLLKSINQERDNDCPPYTEIESLENKHICKYCGEITEGTFEDLLCEECRDIFGHSLYSEL